MSSGDDNVIYFCLSSFYHTASQPVSLVGQNVGGIFRATRPDENSNWAIELLGLDLDLGAPISDIAVDPDNSDIVWITLGSFVEGMKVFRSEDGGATWTNESGCLPNIPFSSIICQGGGSNQVYAGSDFGMYYKDDNLLNEEQESDWIFYADGPRALISDMEINRCANKIVVATMGLGLWEVDLVKGAPTIVEVNSSLTWDTDRQLLGDLIIENGATLTINNSTISISRLVDIIVEPGGTLVINNSTLTNGCGDLWEGIDVWGDASQHQFAQSGSYLQGRLEVKNNSVIEYARTAVKLGRDGDEENLFTGGIINANGSTFRNNQTGIRFDPYTNTVPAPNAPVFGNASSITDCTFITNEPLPENLHPIAFISLWGVDDIPIARSNFMNDLASANTTASLGKGIYSQDASFIVSGGENIESTFTNLSHGVHAQSGSSMRNFTVDYVNFVNCNNGVYFSAVNFAKVTRSFFNFGNVPNGVARTYGIVNENSTGFQIEENEFSAVQEVNSQTIGTLMAFTGSDNNQIYNNKFTGLNYANWAIGDNAASGFGDGGNTGLVYQCNTQDNSLEYDINVLYGTGIRVLQGSVDQFLNYFPAQNTFSNTGTNTWSDIAVIGGSTNNMNYVYGPGASEEPLFVTSSKVNKTFSFNNTDGCQSSFGKPNEKEVKKTEYNGTNEKYTTRKQSYNERVDNGNTEHFLNQISVVNPNNQNLKNQLLAASPYVSTEVLEKIVETGAFTQSFLYSILKANPDAVRQSGLLAVSSVPSNLSTAQFQDLEQNAGNMTERGEMELLLTSLKAEKDRYANELVHIYLKEERTSVVNQEIVSWLETTESLATTYAKVDLLFETGARTEARNLFLMVPQLFSLNVEENLEYQDLRTLYQLLYQLPANARNEAYFTESEYETVDGLAASGNGKARSKAKNIMEFFYGKIYPLELPEQASLNEATQETTIVESQASESSNEKFSLVTVFPNPASTNVNIRYASPSLYGNKGEIIVIDFYGKTFFQEQIDNQEKNFSINVTNWPSGMYYCIHKSTETKKQLIPFFINH